MQDLAFMCQKVKTELVLTWQDLITLSARPAPHLHAYPEAEPVVLFCSFPVYKWAYMLWMNILLSSKKNHQVFQNLKVLKFWNLVYSLLIGGKYYTQGTFAKSQLYYCNLSFLLSNYSSNHSSLKYICLKNVNQVNS